MSLGPKRGVCFSCGYDHGDGMGSPKLFDLLREISGLKAELAKLRAASPVAVSDSEMIDAAEAQAALYDGDDRQDIKTDVMNSFYAGIKFALARTAPVVAEGFVIVPKVLTEEMELAGMEASVIRRPSIDDPAYVLSIYNAMLSASPSAAQGEGT